MHSLTLKVTVPVPHLGVERSKDNTMYLRRNKLGVFLPPAGLGSPEERESRSEDWE